MKTNIETNAMTKENVAYVQKDGIVFAGIHLLIDLWGVEHERLNSPNAIDKVLRDAATAAGATILNSDMHHFSPQGVSGVVVLAESHISIHTWPERGYASLDIFVCGECDPYKSIDVFKNYFKPEQVNVSEHKRGLKI